MTKVLKYKLLTTPLLQRKTKFKKIALLYVIICVHIDASYFVSDQVLWSMFPLSFRGWHG